MLEGPGSARPTQGRIQTGIFAPKRLQLLLLLLPVRSGLWIFQGASVNQALSLCGVHPLTDKLCNLLLTTLVPRAWRAFFFILSAALFRCSAWRVAPSGPLLR